MNRSPANMHVVWLPPEQSITMSHIWNVYGSFVTMYLMHLKIHRFHSAAQSFTYPWVVPMFPYYTRDSFCHLKSHNHIRSSNTFLSICQKPLSFFHLYETVPNIFYTGHHTMYDPIWLHSLGMLQGIWSNEISQNCKLLYYIKFSIPWLNYTLPIYVSLDEYLDSFKCASELDGWRSDSIHILH